MEMASSSMPAASTASMIRISSSTPLSVSAMIHWAMSRKVPSMVPAQAKMPASAMISITTPEITAASPNSDQRSRRPISRVTKSPITTP